MDKIPDFTQSLILQKYKVSEIGIKLKNDCSPSVDERFMVIRLPQHLDEVTPRAGNCTYSEMKK